MIAERIGRRFRLGLLGIAWWGLVCMALGEPSDRPPKGEDVLVRQQAERVISGLTGRMRAFGEWVDQMGASIGSGGLAEPWIGPINGARLLASAIALVIGAGVAWSLVSGIRRFAGELRKRGDMTWPRMLLSAVRKPLAFALALVAAYFSVGILLDATGTRGPRFLSGCVYVGLTVAGFWLMFRLIRGVERKLQVIAERSESMLDNVLVPVIGTALRLLVPLLCLTFVRGAVELSDQVNWIAGKTLAILFIGCVAFLNIRTVNVVTSALLKVNRLDVDNNLRAREIHTQAAVIRKIVVVATIFLAASCTLMLFEPVRQLGTSLLASAGIAGIVLGFAAQKTIANLLAGIQIAFSQPIRLDDVVIVENEWGRIEDITLTFVTVRIWDDRRLVLPINYFIEKPFQNWTRNSANLLNSVFLYADYTLPVEPLRAELKRLLEASKLWDGRAWVLQVTDMTPEAMEIRCLMTSSDAPIGWDLKCEIREGLVRFIQENHPECLPRTRAELQRDADLPVR